MKNSSIQGRYPTLPRGKEYRTPGALIAFLKFAVPVRMPIHWLAGVLALFMFVTASVQAGSYELVLSKEQNTLTHPHYCPVFPERQSGMLIRKAA